MIFWLLIAANEMAVESLQRPWAVHFRERNRNVPERLIK